MNLHPIYILPVSEYKTKKLNYWQSDVLLQNMHYNYNLIYLHYNLTFTTVSSGPLFWLKELHWRMWNTMKKISCRWLFMPKAWRKRYSDTVWGSINPASYADFPAHVRSCSVNDFTTSSSWTTAYSLWGSWELRGTTVKTKHKILITHISIHLKEQNENRQLHDGRFPLISGG